MRILRRGSKKHVLYSLWKYISVMCGDRTQTGFSASLSSASTAPTYCMKNCLHRLTRIILFESNPLRVGTTTVCIYELSNLKVILLNWTGSSLLLLIKCTGGKSLNVSLIHASKYFICDKSFIVGARSDEINTWLYSSTTLSYINKGISLH